MTVTTANCDTNTARLFFVRPGLFVVDGNANER